MARRKKASLTDDLLDVLQVVPAWVGPVLAVVAFGVMRFVVPACFQSGDHDPVGKAMGQTFAMVARQGAPFLAVAILLVWILAEVRKWGARRLLGSQSGIGTIRALSWAEFERLVGEAYRRQGFLVEETGDPSGDGGVDLVLRKGAETVLVQCKQWKAWKVGVKPVRELLGVVAARRAARGVVVTSGRFTAEAEEFARGNPIALIDGSALAELVAAVQGKAEPQAPPAPLPSPAPASAAAAVPRCPKCGAAMVLRTATQGARAGSKFWGCPGYPKCRGTRPA